MLAWTKNVEQTVGWWKFKTPWHSYHHSIAMRDILGVGLVQLIAPANVLLIQLIISYK